MRKIGRNKRKKQKKMVIILSLSLLMILTVGYAAFSSNLTINSKGNIMTFTINDYVKDNLFAFYDGIENTPSGHGTPTDTWYNKALDLSPTTATPIQNTLNSFIISSWTNDNGLSFNGVDNIVNTGYNQDVFGQKFTFSFVINITAGNAYRGLYGYHIGMEGEDPFYGLSMQMNGDKADFFYHGTSYIPTFVPVSLDKILNKKQQYTVVYQGGVGIKLYINGEFIGEALDNSYIIPYPEENFVIGQSHPLPERYFQGIIYNFIIYKKVLTEEEIRQNYKIDRYRYQLYA